MSDWVGLAPVPSFTTSKPMRGVPRTAKAIATAASAARPIHSSHSPPLLTGRNGTVVTLLVADHSRAPAGANVAHAYRRTHGRRSSENRQGAAPRARARWLDAHLGLIEENVDAVDAGGGRENRIHAGIVAEDGAAAARHMRVAPGDARKRREDTEYGGRGADGAPGVGGTRRQRPTP